MSALLFATHGARADVIHVGPSDSYQKIEQAGAGDEVVLAPGTYRFRVYLHNQATPENPLLIHGEDPANPPVWDLANGNVEDAPGSYTAGDRGRGCWQLSGATSVHISDIIIRNCHNADHNSAGLRYYNGSHDIQLNHLVFSGSDNGLTGGTQDSDIDVEFSEFDSNGSELASNSAPSHNLYIYGGTFALRFSYVHDPVQAQNFHIRAKQARIEYNWFARAKSYQGDLMTDDDYDGSGSLTQTMLLRGNVLVQGDSQANTSQIVALYNDAGASGLTLEAQLVYNTFVGNGGHAALVHLSNADGTNMRAELTNNLIYGTSLAARIEDTSHAMLTGTNNWLQAGAEVLTLENSIFGADSPFKDAAHSDFTLQAGSNAIGAASASSQNAPDREYYRDETTAREYRVRTSALDVGAFESTTTGPGAGEAGEAGSTASGGAEATASGGSQSGGSQSSGSHSGGVLASGGSQSGGSHSGGVLASGGTSAPSNGGASAGGDETTKSGCACRAGAGRRGAWQWLGFCALGLALLARRRTLA